MAIDVQSTKITWAALYVIAGLVFSSGIAWNTLLNTVKENETQWRYINKNTTRNEEQDRYISKIDSISAHLDQSSKNDKLLGEAMIKLTASVDNWNMRAARDDKERERAEQFMINLSKQVNNIEIKIGRIEEKLK